MQPIKTARQSEDNADQPLAPRANSTSGVSERSTVWRRESQRDPLFPNATEDEEPPVTPPAAKHSIARLAMLLVILAALVAIVSMAMNQRSVVNGSPRGAAEDLPNMPTDIKPR
ncbi:MAG TPA: hypothetical protein VER96_12445 [Polyangiaceae bacterium]|nr:hypothetical protein [Polyangiaceae bacterium]